MPLKTPVKLSRTMRSHSSGSQSAKPTMVLPPALLIRIEMPPRRSAAVSTAARRASASVTSTVSATPSISLAVAWALAPSMSSTATVAPSAAKRRQAARPMPDPPPVTTARRPSRRPMSAFLVWRDELVAELALEHLALGIAGEGLGPEPDVGRHLEARQPLPHVPAELLGGHLGPRSQDDGGADLLPEDVVGDPDDRGVGDRRMLEQGGFHLDRVHVLAPTDHHVLGPVHDVHESVLVDPGDVAGVEPALREGRRRGLGLVPVAAHHVGAFDPQLAGDRGPGGQVA